MRSIWPGDTFGIALLPGTSGTKLAHAWGSAIDSHRNSAIYGAGVTLTPNPGPPAKW